jgi:hypothetical protein
MHAEKQHRGREHHHVVDRERLHGAAGERDVAVHVGLGDGLALAVLVRDAAADALVAQADVAVEPVGRCADALVHEVDRLLADHRVLDVADDLLPRHGLDVVGVDVADQHVLEIAPAGVALGMRQDLAGVGEDARLLGRQQIWNRSRGRIHRLSSG